MLSVFAADTHLQGQDVSYSDNYVKGYHRGFWNGFSSTLALCFALAMASRLLEWP